MNPPLTETCIPRAGRLRQSVERQPSPFFAMAQQHADQVPTCPDDEKQAHKQDTVWYLLMGLRHG